MKNKLLIFSSSLTLIPIVSLAASCTKQPRTFDDIVNASAMSIDNSIKVSEVKASSIKEEDIHIYLIEENKEITFKIKNILADDKAGKLTVVVTFTNSKDNATKDKTFTNSKFKKD